MKKILFILLTALLVLTACSKKETATQSNQEPQKETTKELIKVSCTADPHCQILKEATKALNEKGYDLEIIELTDYYVFNRALDAKQVDANFFQHVPFFLNEVATNNYNIVNVAGIHIEPFGFYSKSIKNVSELKDGDTIIISNSVADQGRILNILAQANLITLKEGFDPITGNINDVVESKFNFKEIDPQLLATAYENNEAPLIGINGNYALSAGLNPSDAIVLEVADEKNPYVNILATHKDLENSDKIKALKEVLTSNEIKEYINKTWTDKAVIPAK